MDDLILHSSLTEEQIENNFKDMDFFSALTKGLEESFSCERGALARYADAALAEQEKGAWEREVIRKAASEERQQRDIQTIG